MLDSYIDYRQKEGRSADAVPLLRELVAAIDSANVTTWLIDPFVWREQLTAAKEWLDNFERENNEQI